MWKHTFRRAAKNSRTLKTLSCLSSCVSARTYIYIYYALVCTTTYFGVQPRWSVFEASERAQTSNKSNSNSKRNVCWYYIWMDIRLWNRWSFLVHIFADIARDIHNDFDRRGKHIHGCCSVCHHRCSHRALAHRWIEHFCLAMCTTTMRTELPLSAKFINGFQ